MEVKCQKYLHSKSMIMLGSYSLEPISYGIAFYAIQFIILSIIFNMIYIT